MKHKLPVIAAEVGDTWVHGIASDPYKLKLWRLGSRYVADQFVSIYFILPIINDFRVRAGKWITHSADTRAFLTLFLKNAEHTWGFDFKTWLNDTFAI